MKQFVFFSLILFLQINLVAQAGNVGIGTTSPDASAALDILSNDKGILIPRLPTSQREMITAPAQGLLVYDTSTNTFWYFSTVWTEISQPVTDNLGNHTATQDLDMDGQRITNLDDPTLDNDAATKFYVDASTVPLQNDISDNASDIGTNTLNINSNSANIFNNTLAINTHTSNDTDLSPTNELQTLSISGQDLTLSSGNTITLPDDGGVFENTGGVVRNTGASSDDFVFGSAELPPNGVSTSDTLFFFDKSKAAFRFGTLENSLNWSSDSIGVGSLAFGLNPIAKGDGSISLGFATKARGNLSMALGAGTIANAQHSVAMGYQSQALGNSAVALGSSNIAQGDESFVVGQYSEANGGSSSAIGQYAISDAYSSLAIGSFNEGGGDPNNWVLTDPIFEVGIGQDATNTKNAMTIQKNGTVSFKSYTFPNSDGTVDQIMKTDGSGILSWTNETPVVFEVNSGVVRSTGAYSNDFIFGAMGLPINSNLATGEVFFFDDSKGAFRAGVINNSMNWSTDFLGDHSAAFGFNTLASGSKSFAAGHESKALGNFSVAMGFNCEASGPNSTSFGKDNKAAEGAIALGFDTEASGLYCTTMGTETLASGFAATSMGFSTTAIGIGSTAMGISTDAVADYSTALGNNTTASGENSISMGNSTLASGESSTAMGRFTDASGESSTAMGRSTDASGDNSTALGNGSSATGLNSTSTGNSTLASGDNSISMGSFTEAAGNNSIAAGSQSSTSGLHSFAMGLSASASGRYSTAFGSDVNAEAINAFVIGRNNVGGGSNDQWLLTDPIFEIGIGSGVSGNENALTVYKNGNAEINGDLTVGNSSGSFFNLGLNTLESVSNMRLSVDANFIPSADNSFNLGVPSNRWDNIHANNGVIQTSDKRLKKNISKLKYGLHEILALQPVEYNWKKEEATDKKHVGLIAQELLELIPEVVNEEGEYLGVKYAELVPVLINALKEQHVLIHDQKKAIGKLKKENRSAAIILNDVLDRIFRLENLDQQISNSE